MAELFGFRIERPKKDEGGIPSFVSPTADDGTIDVASGQTKLKEKLEMSF